MSKGLSRNGGDSKIQSNLTIEECDGLNCSRCGLEIITPYEEIGQKIIVYRTNRIDCEDYKLDSYHLFCYQLEALGKISKWAIEQMNRWEDQFGEA